ncbi:hypothetical protein NDU88_004063 [Pleurodeles waltl]|uniref:Uncharacterized protein n=1 Tax=Pleurodeles waltl TaxID=8319 RepID=A0AAV7VJ73_PLEWA|nr:hypothetical protein NDU88_004063 [Pleurodeles waltl]
MYGDKGGRAVQQNNLDKYTIPKGTASAEAPPDLGVAAPAMVVAKTGPLTLQDIMEAIQGVHASLDSRINSVTSEVTLLQAAIHNMGTHV